MGYYQTAELIVLIPSLTLSSARKNKTDLGRVFKSNITESLSFSRIKGKGPQKIYTAKKRSFRNHGQLCEAKLASFLPHILSHFLPIFLFVTSNN